MIIPVAGHHITVYTEGEKKSHLKDIEIKKVCKNIINTKIPVRLVKTQVFLHKNEGKFSVMIVLDVDDDTKKTSPPSARVAATRSMQQENGKNKTPFKHS